MQKPKLTVFGCVLDIAIIAFLTIYGRNLPYGAIAALIYKYSRMYKLYLDIPLIICLYVYEFINLPVNVFDLGWLNYRYLGDRIDMAIFAFGALCIVTLSRSMIQNILYMGTLRYRKFKLGSLLKPGVKKCERSECGCEYRRDHIIDIHEEV